MESFDINCACLVSVKQNKLLLVRVRDNKKWYLPGGKIEIGETAEAALQREIKEELNVTLKEESIQYFKTIIGPSYPQDKIVKLVCFYAEWIGCIQKANEISEVKYIDMQRRDLFAPALCLLCDELLQTTSSSSI